MLGSYMLVDSRRVSVTCQTSPHVTAATSWSQVLGTTEQAFYCDSKSNSPKCQMCNILATRIIGFIYFIYFLQIKHILDTQAREALSLSRFIVLVIFLQHLLAPFPVGYIWKHENRFSVWVIYNRLGQQGCISVLSKEVWQRYPSPNTIRW